MHEGCHLGGNADLANGFGDKYQNNGINVIKSSCYMTEERRTTVLESAEGDIQNLALNASPLAT